MVSTEASWWNIFNITKEIILAQLSEKVRNNSKFAEYVENKRELHNLTHHEEHENKSDVTEVHIINDMILRRMSERTIL